VLVLDQAGWHISPKLAVPEGIHLVFLPSHTPELQPTERIWPYVREEFANATPPDRASLHERLERRCAFLANHPEVIRGATLFHWWPSD
jgi:transposase